MRIAALSDIHSNVYALEAVIEDIKKREVDIALSLGDMLYGPIAPYATYTLLRKNNLLFISGNQDREIVEAASLKNISNPTMADILDELAPEALAWMQSLPFDRKIDDEIYLCHGSPTDDRCYLLEDVKSGEPQVRSEKGIIERLNGESSPLIFCGHTHTPRVVSLSTGQLIVNPGSVGMPAYSDDTPYPHRVQNFAPHATYAISEKNTHGYTVQHIRVPYDVMKAKADAARHHRKDWADLLVTGRV